MEDQFDELIGYCTEEGTTAPSFHLYVVRSEEEDQPDLSLTSIWGDDAEVETFLLEEGDWKVDLFEITPKELPHSLEDALVGSLEEATETGAPLAWFMLDGAFESPDALASDWGAKNTYAISVGEAHFCADESGRLDPNWVTVIREAVTAAGFRA